MVKQNRLKVAFVCHFSNELVRKQLPLKTWNLRNFVLKRLNHPLFKYQDFAIWVDDFIEMFKENSDVLELHVIAPHKGLTKLKSEFTIDQVYYHFYKTDGNLLYDVFCAKTRWNERHDYNVQSLRAARLVGAINPDVVCLCGAENPEYSSIVFKINNRPVYLIPQTFLNDTKRIAMKVASTYRVAFEKRVFETVDYVSSKNEKIQKFAQECNPKVQFFPLTFPSHQPPIYDVSKKFDFVFFASNVMKNKGIEDLLRAVSVVKMKKEDVTLNVIGGCESAYKSYLNELVRQLGIKENVKFSGKYVKIDDVFYNVQKAKVVVVPGITAGLNSTVRESMLMGMPVITYETTSTELINKERLCLLTAKMEDVVDLADKMICALSNARLIAAISNNGKEYADREFSNSRIGFELMNNLKFIDNDYRNKYTNNKQNY